MNLMLFLFRARDFFSLNTSEKTTLRRADNLNQKWQAFKELCFELLLNRVKKAYVKSLPTICSFESTFLLLQMNKLLVEIPHKPVLLCSRVI